MRRPTLIILSCIGFILGILLGYYFKFDLNIWWFVFLIVSLASVFILSKKLKVISSFLMMLVLAIVIMTSRINYIAKNGISDKLFIKSSVSGKVTGDPYWDKDRNYVFTISNLKIDGKPRAESIKVKTFSSAVKEGNMVMVEGKIYPTMAKPGYVLTYAKVSVIDNSQPILVQAKNLLYKGADISIGGEPANFIKGILVGARTSLSQDLQDTLNSTGLSHVVAVSGYNLTILVVVLQKLLRKKWAWGSLVFSLVLVWSFVLLTGGSASILRAAIMASLFLIASYYGRAMSIFACISLTALITLLINPMALTEDVGWQLSFLSLTGIVVIAPALEKLLPKKPKTFFEIVSITLAAQIATVPYLLYLFGSYSAVAFIANTLIMPIIPILMLIGFVLAIMGLLLPEASVFLGSLVAQSVNYIFDFLKYLQYQQAFQIKSSPDLLVLGLWYFCILFVGLVVYNKGISSSFQKHQELVK